MVAGRPNRVSSAASVRAAPSSTSWSSASGRVTDSRMPSRAARAWRSAGGGTASQPQLLVGGADGGEQAGVGRGAVTGFPGGARRRRGVGAARYARSSSTGIRSWLISGRRGRPRRTAAG